MRPSLAERNYGRIFLHIYISQTASGPSSPDVPSPQSRYSLEDVAAVLVTGRAFGLSRFRDFQHIENDPLLASLFDLPKPPDIASLYRELSRFGRDRVADALASIDKQVSLSIGKEVIPDIDSTAETVYGHQEGASVGYNPAKRERTLLRTLELLPPTRTG